MALTRQCQGASQANKIGIAHGLRECQAIEAAAQQQHFDALGQQLGDAVEPLLKIAKPATAPEMSIITSSGDIERDATNDWWNSSLTAKIAQANQTPTNNVDILAHKFVPLRSARQRRAARQSEPLNGDRRTRDRDRDARS